MKRFTRDATLMRRKRTYYNSDADELNFSEMSFSTSRAWVAPGWWHAWAPVEIFTIATKERRRRMYLPFARLLLTSQRENRPTRWLRSASSSRTNAALEYRSHKFQIFSWRFREYYLDITCRVSNLLHIFVYLLAFCIRRQFKHLLHIGKAIKTSIDEPTLPYGVLFYAWEVLRITRCDFIEICTACGRCHCKTAILGNVWLNSCPSSPFDSALEAKTWRNTVSP